VTKYLLPLSLSGLIARIIDETRSMTDVYSAFYEFSSLLESKVLGCLSRKHRVSHTYNRRFRYFVMYIQNKGYYVMLHKSEKVFLVRRLVVYGSLRMLTFVLVNPYLGSFTS
jgi:hypothetical protein